MERQKTRDGWKTPESETDDGQRGLRVTEGRSRTPWRGLSEGTTDESDLGSEPDKVKTNSGRKGCRLRLNTYTRRFVESKLSLLSIPV